MNASRRDRRSYLPEVKEEMRLREELKREALQTAAYCRLSVFDSDEDSIDTQVEITHSYIEENPELTLAATYIDNGFTGTDFDRPGWNALIQDIQNGKVSCIVVKDLSRFARNHIEAGHLIERIFPMFAIRFIAITDNFDSAVDDINDGFLVPTKNIMNALYARDISHKIRASFLSMKREGKMCNATVPYGYAYMDGHMVIHPEEARMVRMIFKWAKLGVNPEEITARLRLMEEIKQSGHPWNAAHVREILQNPAYTGTFITGKESYSMKKRKKLPEEAWFVFEGKHEAILSREDFDTVNRCFARESCTTEADKRPAEGNRGTNPLSGLVYCAVCGKRMRRDTCRYYCPRHAGKNITEENIEAVVSIPEKTLTQRILRRCRAYRNELENVRPILNRAERNNGVLDRITTEATVALAEKKKVEAEGELLFEQLGRKEISEAEFREARYAYRKRLEEKQDALNAILKRQRAVKTRISRLRELVKASDETERIQMENIRIFVERVNVLPSGVVKIQLKCQDMLQSLMKGEIG